MIEILVALLLSFGITYILVPGLIPRLKKRGIVGKDVHKKEKPDIPEMGGLSVIVGLICGISLIYLFYHDDRILIATLSILMLSLVGIMDDLIGLKHVQKVLLACIAGIPIVALKPVQTVIIFPIFGAVDFFSFYWIMVFLGVTAASNATNMLAGFNGLEAGMGAISAFTLFLCSLLLGSKVASLVSISLFGSLIAFLYYNKYPSKIFPGDSCTLTIGGTIAIASILGKLEFIGALCLLPAIIDFLMKATIGFKGKSKYGSSTLREDNTIEPSKFPSIIHIPLNMFRLTEKELVNQLYILQIFNGIMTLAIAILFLR
ncbi:MAG: glycosyltransferase 4 family protein [Candidatus Hydrothermarchaeota archaeon]